MCFAAIKKLDGSVVTWGDPSSGGNSTAVKENLQNIKKIYSTDSAFAALNDNNGIVTWGDDVKNDLLHIIVVWAEGGIDGIEDLWLNKISINDSGKNRKSYRRKYVRRADFEVCSPTERESSARGENSYKK